MSAAVEGLFATEIYVTDDGFLAIEQATRPATTYDNFARDFGERFVPGYKAPSTVDYLLNAPFSD